MTRKDYELIAATLRSTKPPITGDGPFWASRLIQWQETVDAFAGSLNATNPRFDADRFAAACGYYEEV